LSKCVIARPPVAADRLRYSTDPPKALIATIVWDSGAGQVTSVNVWDTPGAIADFYMDRVRPIVEAEGQPTSKPERHCERSRSIFAISSASYDARSWGGATSSIFWMLHREHGRPTTPADLLFAVGSAHPSTLPPWPAYASPQLTRPHRPSSVGTPLAQAGLSGDPGALASLLSTTPGAASRTHEAQDCLW
jgi:hypothetical protein